MVKASTLIGKPAPPLTLPSVTGETYKLPLGEKPIALFFFPQAFTTGCVKEACAFRDAKVKNDTFKRHPDLEVVGISGDETTKQQAFRDEYNLSYPIVSDVDNKAREAYGVEKAFLGLAPGRATYFIDSKGVIRGICDKNIDFSAHTKFVEKMLKDLEKSDSV